MTRTISRLVSGLVSRTQVSGFVSGLVSRLFAHSISGLIAGLAISRLVSRMRSPRSAGSSSTAGSRSPSWGRLDAAHGQRFLLLFIDIRIAALFAGIAGGAAHLATGWTLGHVRQGHFAQSPALAKGLTQRILHLLLALNSAGRMRLARFAGRRTQSGAHGTLKDVGVVAPIHEIAAGNAIVERVQALVGAQIGKVGKARFKAVLRTGLNVHPIVGMVGPIPIALFERGIPAVPRRGSRHGLATPSGIVDLALLARVAAFLAALVGTGCSTGSAGGSIVQYIGRDGNFACLFDEEVGKFSLQIDIAIAVVGLLLFYYHCHLATAGLGG